MDLKKVKIGILGAGAMGTNIIRGLVKAKIFSSRQIVASDIVPEKLQKLRKSFTINSLADNKGLVSQSDIIIIAVKPQAITSVLEEIAPVAKKTKLFISIAAGITTDAIARGLAGRCRVLRIMPNIAAGALESASALCAGPGADERHITIAKRIFETIGKVVVVEERLMDAVTGLSGSGPAYVFLFIEAFCDAGVKVGLDRNTALQLAVQTCLGAARLLLETEQSPASLKNLVTSPAGTTIAGLHVLEQGGFKGLVMDAVEAATNRSKQLGGS